MGSRPRPQRIRCVGCDRMRKEKRIKRFYDVPFCRRCHRRLLLFELSNLAPPDEDGLLAEFIRVGDEPLSWRQKLRLQGLQLYAMTFGRKSAESFLRLADAMWKKPVGNEVPLLSNLIAARAISRHGRGSGYEGVVKKRVEVMLILATNVALDISLSLGVREALATRRLDRSLDDFAYDKLESAGTHAGPDQDPGAVAREKRYREAFAGVLDRLRAGICESVPKTQQ